MLLPCPVVFFPYDIFSYVCLPGNPVGFLKSMAIAVSFCFVNGRHGMQCGMYIEQQMLSLTTADFFKRLNLLG